jgi:hypothetical protein
LPVGTTIFDTAAPLRPAGRRHMLIDEDFREFVGYLGIDDGYVRASGPKPVATLFFIHFQDSNGGGIYAVTARHCINGGDRFYIQRRGAPEDIVVDSGQWILHPTTDIAVCPMQDGIFAASKAYRLSADVLSNRHFVSSGKEIFTVGLFARLAGRSAVEPIVRFGHVALATAEAEIELAPVTQPGQLTLVHARLIETRSWGGESGSPVFIHSQYYQSHRGPPDNQGDLGVYTPGVPRKSEIKASQTDCALLGLLHGHFQMDLPSREGSILDVNAGIAVVIPVEYIWRFFVEDERLIEHRKRAPRRPTVPPKPDSARSDQT